jgi:hypothetical protein
MVGARSCAGAVAAHSRSDRPSGAGGGAIGAGDVGDVGAGGVDGAAASLPPQLLQKFAPSRFSALHTGQIKAMTTDFWGNDFKKTGCEEPSGPGLRN